MRGRVVFIADYNLESQMRYSSHFVSKGFTIFSTDLKGFSGDFLNLLDVCLFVIADPDEIPGGVFLNEQIQTKYPNVPTMVLCSSAERLSVVRDMQEGPTVKAVLRNDNWENIVSSIMELLLIARKSKDGRRHERKDVQIPVLCEVLGMSRFFSGEIQNVSQSGAFVVSRGPIPSMGEAVDLEIESKRAGLTKIQASGVVRWIRESSSAEKNPGFGVEFAYFDCDERDALKTLNLEF